MSLLLRAGVLVLLCASLTGCGSLGTIFGNAKSPPDEFAVLTKAPLVVPPEFSLKPPRADARGPQEVEPGERARQTVFGLAPSAEETRGNQSNGELALLERAGADRADPAIRDLVSAEYTAVINKDRGFAERIMFWTDNKPPAEPTVDGKAEAERIRTNEAEGKPASEGVDKSEKKDKGLFGGLFGG